MRYNALFSSVRFWWRESHDRSETNFQKRNLILSFLGFGMQKIDQTFIFAFTMMLFYDIFFCGTKSNLQIRVNETTRHQLSMKNNDATEL